jgi:hypothetical protein
VCIPPEKWGALPLPQVDEQLETVGLLSKIMGGPTGKAEPILLITNDV